jgi:hypothetical protein
MKIEGTRQYHQLARRSLATGGDRTLVKFDPKRKRLRVDRHLHKRSEST